VETGRKEEKQQQASLMGPGFIGARISGPFMFIGGSAPLQWRVLTASTPHERHWSAALPAMNGSESAEQSAVAACPPAP
jgi:hypothetical protein